MSRLITVVIVSTIIGAVATAALVYKHFLGIDHRVKKWHKKSLLSAGQSNKKNSSKKSYINKDDYFADDYKDNYFADDYKDDYFADA